jgi:histidinol dehydrogenase
MRIIKDTEIDGKFYEFKDTEILPKVYEILDDIKKKGDEAVKEYTEKFDKVKLAELRINDNEIKEAYKALDKDTIEAIEYSAANIKKFAKKQLECFRDFEYEIEPGVFTGQKIIPIERVGVYVPGGRFPLVSTLLMGALPAQVAGVKEIAVFSPPTHNSSLHPAILVAADKIGIKEIYKVGGVQSIGAMAYGSESIKKVDKIVGPGNKYVAFAKKVVYGITGIDFIAGPTEVLIIADKFANPEFIACDLIAQAEHDIDAEPILITDSEELAKAVIEKVNNNLQTLETKEIAKVSLERNGKIILVKDIKDSIEIANRKAPEHLEIQLKDTEYFIKNLKNYGTLFIGENSAEVLGDYSSGLNHTLPTNYSSRYTGGLSVKDYIKIQTTLRVEKNSLGKIGIAAKNLANIEGLMGHKKSIEVRM